MDLRLSLYCQLSKSADKVIIVIRFIIIPRRIHVLSVCARRVSGAGRCALGCISDTPFPCSACLGTHEPLLPNNAFYPAPSLDQTGLMFGVKETLFECLAYQISS